MCAHVLNKYMLLRAHTHKETAIAITENYDDFRFYFIFSFCFVSCFQFLNHAIYNYRLEIMNVTKRFMIKSNEIYSFLNAQIFFRRNNFIKHCLTELIHSHLI